ncbi:MAG TPA: hypothetical protein VLQ45_33730 [Thermoanaerobaculia bacterium]|nr:hypothetical protein [Thermoanaerobaculia bacterium]
MKVLRRAALLVFLFLTVFSALFATPPRLEVEAPPELEPAARRIRDFPPEELESAQRLTGLEDPGPPIRVILAPEGSGLALAVPPWVSGYAYSDRGIIVLLPSRTPSYPDSSLEDLLRHEVAHVLIARASGNRPLPRWFHEGTAMIAGLTWGLDDRTRLTMTLLADRQVSLTDLEERFQGGGAEVHRAYAISGAFVRGLLERHGPDAVGRILAGVREGLPFEDAFRRATGETLGEAETSFWRRQSFWYRWVPILTSSALLWIAITLLFLWAVRRRRARDAALRRVWEEEEERLRLAAEARMAEGDGGELVN